MADPFIFHDSYGDGVERSLDGYYWIKGRVDDVINVSGHRMSTAEVESSLVMHAGVSEAAVVGAPDEVTGQGELGPALRERYSIGTSADSAPYTQPSMPLFA